jgi:hypothetical protein
MVQQSTSKYLKRSDKYQGLGKELQLNLIVGDKVLGLPGGVVPFKVMMWRSWYQCDQVFPSVSSFHGGI